MSTKPQQGKWYRASRTVPYVNKPWQETHCVTECMRVGTGMLVRTVTYICTSKNKELAPVSSSESMAFVPNVIFEVDEEGTCIFEDQLTN